MVLIRFLKSALSGGKQPARLAPVVAPPTEVTALIEAHLAGDPRAFGLIVARYQVRLLNFVYRMIGDRERAEDLVQEAFLRVHRHLDRFDRSRKFSTWVYTIASNLAKNELRNRGRSPLVTFEQARPRDEEDNRPVDFEDKDNRPDDLFEQRTLKTLVDETVAKLSSHHREVFVLRELEGKSYEEIAEIMHCNLGTVKSRLNRARQSFAELIQPHLD
jgi:RNA polymerase sigma-70 factor (ECF subfamily)